MSVGEFDPSRFVDDHYQTRPLGYSEYAPLPRGIWGEETCSNATRTETTLELILADIRAVVDALPVSDERDRTIVLRHEQLDLLLKRASPAVKAALVSGFADFGFGAARIIITETEDQAAKERVRLVAEEEMRRMLAPVMPGSTEQLNRQQRRAAERAARKGRRA